jgi:hypothetical protein
MWYHTKPLHQSYLLAFAARVRTGVFGRAIQVVSQSVEKALRHVAQTLLLAGYDDPRCTYGAKELDLPFRHLLKGYKEQDPAPKPQLAFPVVTIKRAGAYYQAPHTPLVWATADLVTIGFFFLLRVGEYTMPRQNVRTRTKQFRVQDVTFRCNGLVLPSTSPPWRPAPCRVSDLIFGQPKEWAARRNNLSHRLPHLVLPRQGTGSARIEHRRPRM